MQEAARGNTVKEVDSAQKWQEKIYEDESVVDGDSSAFLTSVLVHVAILLGLGLVPMISAEDSDIDLTSVVLEEEEIIELDIPEEVAFNDAPMEEIGANSDFSVEMARSEAPVIAEVSDIPEPVDFEQHEIGEIYVNETIDIASGLELNELSAVRGHTGESATGASGAVDRITQEILQSLEERKTLVIWMFDQSGSLAMQRQEIRDRFERIYRELGVLEAAENPAFARHSDKPLLTAVLSFGQQITDMLKEPTDNLSEIKEAIDKIQLDESGVENIFQAVKFTANRYSKYRDTGADGDPKRNVMMIVVCDEVGDDQMTVDDTIKRCRQLAIPVYCVGVPAPFGRSETRMKWVDPDPNYDQTPQWGVVNQGPESCLPERIKLAFSSSMEGTAVIDSGFGPWAMTRMCYATGGIYFAVHPNRNVNKSITRSETSAYSSFMETFFDPMVMRKYRPDYVPRSEYLKRIQSSKMRTALVQAASQSWTAPMQSPQLKFVKRDEAGFNTELSDAQKQAAKLAYTIQPLMNTLQLGEAGREDENSLRWQANYDLAMGRVLATYVRTEAYNQMAAAKRGLKLNDPKRDNTFTLVPADEITVGSQLDKARIKANEYLQRVVDKHEGTPWAHLAQRELETPIGWKWEISFTNLAPPPRPGAGGGGNPAPAQNDQANMLKKPPPKRRPPKL